MVCVHVKKQISLIYIYIFYSQLTSVSRIQYLGQYIYIWGESLNPITIITIFVMLLEAEGLRNRLAGRSLGARDFWLRFQRGGGLIQRACQSQRTLKNQNKSPLQDHSSYSFSPLSFVFLPKFLLPFFWKNWAFTVNTVFRVRWNVTFLIMQTMPRPCLVSTTKLILCTCLCLKPLCVDRGQI